MMEKQAIRVTVRTIYLKKDVQTKIVSLKTNRLLLLTEGLANFLETHKAYRLAQPIGQGNAVFVPKGVKHGLYPFSDCVMQEIIW